jgi:hypothetical protein
LAIENSGSQRPRSFDAVAQLDRYDQERPTSLLFQIRSDIGRSEAPTLAAQRRVPAGMAPTGLGSS